MMKTMIKTKCDSRGRVYIKETLRSRYGEDYMILDSGRGILLLPIPEDAIKDLVDLGRTLKGKSIAQLRAAIRDRARREIRS